MGFLNDIKTNIKHDFMPAAIAGIDTLSEKLEQEQIPVQPMIMRFKDLPKGTRFRYPGDNTIWVAIETYGDGLIAKWEGLIPKTRQSLCCFVDAEWSLESEVEVIDA